MILPAGLYIQELRSHQDGGANFLYVANFSAGKIDVYDSLWAEVEMPFTDPLFRQVIHHSIFGLLAIGCM